MDQPIVQSVERTFTVLELLADNPRGLSLSEISFHTALNKSTAHRLLACLIGMGYAVQDTLSGSYRLTFKLFATAAKLVDGMDVLSAAKPYLDRLSVSAQEAVHLVIPSGINITYIYKVDSEAGSSVRMSSRVGLSIPMYCTGVGKAILAYLPATEVDEIWRSSSIQALTEHTITSHDAFCAQLAQIRQEHYALDNEENEIGVRCVAVPILDYRGTPIAAFSISAPLARMGDTRLQELLPLMMEALRGISAGLGVS